MFNQKLKKMKIRLLAITLLFVGAFMSCTEETAVSPDPTAIELANESDVVRLAGVRGMLQEIMSLGAAQRSNVGGRSSEAGRSASNSVKSRFAQSNAKGDSTDWDDEDDDWDYETCAEVTETENADGSFTIIEDYGADGCEEDGLLIKGKIIETFSYADGVENIETIYEGFYFDGVTIDGIVSAQFTWSENETDSMDFSYTSSWKEDLTISFEDGEVYTIKADFSEEFTEDKLVMTGSYEGSESNGDTFSFVITSPLIYDFTCEDAFVPVQGVEEGTYNDETFSIDYGSGACDNLAIITENGESYEIDFEEEWEEECGDEHGGDGEGTQG